MMEVDREIADVEDQLRSNSLEDVPSCSSSILDTPKRDKINDDFDDDDDCEDDGINVTIRTISDAVFTEDGKGETKDEDPQDVPKQVKTYKRLNGAAKKRFKYLLNQGHKPDQARILAEKPFRIPCTDPSKRRRNSDLNWSNSSEKNPPKKVARLNDKGTMVSGQPSSVQYRLVAARGECSKQSFPQKDSNGALPVSPKATEKSTQPRGYGDAKSTTSYRDALNFIKLGILPHDYPSTEFTTQQMIATQKAILTSVAKQRKEAVKPKFGSCFFRSGHMIIVCKNEDTANWLKAEIPSIKPWATACLTAVDEQVIPRPEILTGFFPRSVEDSNENILALLESQNDGLLVDAWRILKRYVVREHHIELVFTVDATSMKTLEECNFNVDYKFGNAFIRKKGSTKYENRTNMENTAQGNNEQDSLHPECPEGTEDCRGTEVAGEQNNNIENTTGMAVDIVMECNQAVTTSAASHEDGEKGQCTFNAPNPESDKIGQTSSEYRQIQVHAPKFKSGSRNTSIKERRRPNESGNLTN